MLLKLINSTCVFLHFLIWLLGNVKLQLWLALDFYRPLLYMYQ